MTSKIVNLYHESKSGLKGKIKPNSRKECDFGCGFYMGTNKEQPINLISRFKHAHLYTLHLKTEDLTVYTFNSKFLWAMFIAYNRGMIPLNSLLYENLSTTFMHIENHDVIVGTIADDRMFYVLEQFFDDAITDKALYACLDCMKLGSQVVLKTKKACANVEVVRAEKLSIEIKKEYLNKSAQMRKDIGNLVNKLKRENRDGQYFSNILEGGI